MSSQTSSLSLTYIKFKCFWSWKALLQVAVRRPSSFLFMALAFCKHGFQGCCLLAEGARAWRTAVGGSHGSVPEVVCITSAHVPLSHTDHRGSHRYKEEAMCLVVSWPISVLLIQVGKSPRSWLFSGLFTTVVWCFVEISYHQILAFWSWMKEMGYHELKGLGQRPCPWCSGWGSAGTPPSPLCKGWWLQTWALNSGWRASSHNFTTWGHVTLTCC